MPHPNYPLPNVVWLEGAFVHAEFSDVLARFRGEMAAVIAGQNIEQYEATGKNAKIQVPLGDETFAHMHPLMRKKAEEGFSVNGFARVSLPRCNSKWVFVEPPFGVGSDTFFLSKWCQGAPVLHVWSGLFSYELDVAGDYELDNAGDKQATEAHGFCYEAEGRKLRWLEWQRCVHEGTRLINRRRPLPFENTAHYTAKKTRDRMNRRVLFEILENLAIDALSVFGARELDKPHLYTSEPVGKTCEGYAKERARYESYFLSDMP